MNNIEEIESVWNEFGKGLRLFILSRVSNEADAEDILQDTFLKIHEKIHTLKDSASIKPWIYQIARNLIADYYRIKNRDLLPEGILSDISGLSSSNKIMDIAINDMIRMMEELSPEYCEALCLTEIEGLSQKDFAEMKGLTYSGAKSRVQRARLMLKDLLLSCCHYQFDRYGTVFDIQAKCCCCSHEK